MGAPAIMALDLLALHYVSMSPVRVLHPHAICAVAEYVGDYRTLALILNVTVEDLCRWAAGRGSPPVEVSLRLWELSLDAGCTGVQESFSG